MMPQNPVNLFIDLSKFLHVHVIFIQIYPRRIFHAEAAFGSPDLQPVHPRILPAGAYKRAVKSSRILQLDVRPVLHLEIIVFSIVQRGKYPVRHAEQPLPDVKIMLALVDQETAALALPGAPPGSGPMVCRSPEPCIADPDRPLKLSQTAGCDNLPGLLIRRVGAHVKNHSIAHPGFLCPAQETPHFTGAYPSRLIGEDMLSRLRSPAPDFHMACVRRNNHRRVKIAAVGHRIVHILINSRTRKFPAQPLLSRKVSAAHPGQGHALHFPFIQHLHILASHASKPDNGCSDLIHRFLLFPRCLLHSAPSCRKVRRADGGSEFSNAR